MIRALGWACRTTLVAMGMERGAIAGSMIGYLAGLLWVGPHSPLHVKVIHFIGSLSATIVIVSIAAFFRVRRIGRLISEKLDYEGHLLNIAWRQNDLEAVKRHIDNRSALIAQVWSGECLTWK